MKIESVNKLAYRKETFEIAALTKNDYDSVCSILLKHAETQLKIFILKKLSQNSTAAIQTHSVSTSGNSCLFSLLHCHPI